jgi:hypothetical protein
MQVSKISLAVLLVWPLISCGSAPLRVSTNSVSHITVPPVTVDPPRGSWSLPIIPLNISVDITGKIKFSLSSIKIPTPIGTFDLSAGSIGLNGEDVKKTEEKYKNKRVLIIRVDKRVNVYELEKGKKFKITVKSEKKLFKQVGIEDDGEGTMIVELASTSVLSNKSTIKNKMDNCGESTSISVVSSELQGFFENQDNSLSIQICPQQGSDKEIYIGSHHYKKVKICGSTIRKVYEWRHGNKNFRVAWRPKDPNTIRLEGTYHQQHTNQLLKRKLT